jgi:hypothetical protein
LTLVDDTTLEPKSAGLDADNPELVTSVIELREAIDSLDNEEGIIKSIDAVEAHRQRHPYDGWFLDVAAERLQRRLAEVRGLVVSCD